MRLSDLHPYNTEAGMVFTWEDDFDSTITITYSDNERVEFIWKNGGKADAHSRLWSQCGMFTNSGYTLKGIKIEGFEL